MQEERIKWKKTDAEVESTSLDINIKALPGMLNDLEVVTRNLNNSQQSKKKVRKFKRKGEQILQLVPIHFRKR